MGSRLFYKRLAYEWRQKLQALRSVADWTVMLYLVIPALLFGALFYRSLWLELPAWAVPMPAAGWLFLLYLITYGRQARSFLEAADGVFLLQHGAVLQAIIHRGTLYTALRVMLTSTLLMLAVWPLLQGEQVLFLGVLFIWIRLLQTLTSRLLVRRWNGRWYKRGLDMLQFLAGWMLLQYSVQMVQTAVALLCASIIYAGAGWWLLRVHLRYRPFLLQEIAQEQREAMRWTAFLLQRGGHVQKPQVTRRPLLLPGSKRLRRQGSHDWRITELFLKEYFRTGANVRFYGQLVAYSIVPLYIAPWWLALLVGFFALYGLYQHSGAHWTGFTNTPVLQRFREQGRFLLLGHTARAWSLCPALALYAAAGCFYVHLWLGAAVVLICSTAAVFMLFLPSRRI